MRSPSRIKSPSSAPKTPLRERRAAPASPFNSPRRRETLKGSSTLFGNSEPSGKENALPSTEAESKMTAARQTLKAYLAAHPEQYHALLGQANIMFQRKQNGGPTTDTSDATEQEQPATRMKFL